MSRGAKPGERRGGRAKGTPNKLSATVKDNVIQVFNDIGGVETMAEWAAENKTQFFNLYAKLLPFTIGGDPNNPLITKIEREIVSPKDSNG